MIRPAKGATTMTSLAHVAIIMDGNGRWAKARGLPRLAGHRAGVEALRRTVQAAGDLGIQWLTVYAFSSENWSRPKSEVSDLMGLLRLFIRRDLADLHHKNVRIRVIGDRHGLEPDIRVLLDEAEALTINNRRLNLVIAFNYGGRDEIVRTVRRIAQAAERGLIRADEITSDSFAAFLDTAHIPDPDIVIRTSGELRLSNFLLWQAAYSELVFLPCYWPDFSERDLREAVATFSRRERRFGGLASADAAAS